MKVVSGIKTPPLQTQVLTQPPIKVCMHVLGCARTDGRVMREATALVEAGFAVSIVDIECDQGLPPAEEIRGVHVKHIILPSWHTPTRFKPWFLVKLAQAFICGIMQMTHITADIYHAHDENALPACYLAARLRRKPLIFDAHELPLSEPSVHRWPQLHTIATGFLRYFIGYCTGVITVSQPIAQEIRNRYHVQTVSLIRNIPPYAVVPTSDRLRQSLGLNADVRIALYQGNLHTERGLTQIIHAASFLEPDIVIAMMGNGPQEIVDQLETLIAHQGVADRVKILPPVPYDDLLEWTVSADVGLIVYSPDYSANIRMCLPNKLFEYLMVGLPVLSSELDAIVEVINTYEVGQVVSLLTPQEIGQAINSMLANRIALACMRHNALQLSQQEFCWEKESQVLVRLYRDIVETQSRENGRARVLSNPSTVLRDTPASQNL